MTHRELADWFRVTLFNEARALMKASEGDLPPVDRAIRAEGLSARLLWMSGRWWWFSRAERRTALDLALQLSEHGLKFASELEPCHPTRELLRLMCARVLLSRGEDGPALTYMRSVKSTVRQIQDVWLRARIYRELGSLSLKKGWTEGIFYTMQAYRIWLFAKMSQ